MNLIEKLGLVVGDQVQYTCAVDMEIQKVKSIEADDCTDIRNHISPLTGVIER